jgi:hypothetical protein
MCVVLGGVNVQFVLVVLVPLARRKILERGSVGIGYHVFEVIGTRITEVAIYVAEEAVH